MSAGKLNLTIEQGATWHRRLTWKTGDPATPVDLTGFTARMQVRAAADVESEEVEPGDVLVELTTENSRITLTPEEGRIELDIDAVTTADIEAVEAVYDLELVNGPTVTRLVQGAALISAEVTR